MTVQNTNIIRVLVRTANVRELIEAGLWGVRIEFFFFSSTATTHNRYIGRAGLTSLDNIFPMLNIPQCLLNLYRVRR